MVRIVDKAGRLVCRAEPERRFYPTGAQTTSDVAICPRLLDDLYVVLGERRGRGRQARLAGARYVNPWVRLIFLGPLLIGDRRAISLSDRALRLGVGRRAREVVS